MKTLSDKNKSKLQQRISMNALRSLDAESNLVDFSSNDYLGFSKSTEIFETAHQYLNAANLKQNGATGSRLLSGNHRLYDEVEAMLCKFHKSEAALVFNSGYDANIGFFSSVPLRGDIILYDELIHASIRDGITMSHAKAYKFKHNNFVELEQKLVSLRAKSSDQELNIYVVTESVFSMDGDTPNLLLLTDICEKYHAYVVVDEAHAIGVFGKKGCGEVQRLQLQDKVFARIITFGKALGCHGSAILGSNELKQFLINFARSFIYTTGLPPHALATIKGAYSFLVISNESEKSKLQENILHFKSEIKKSNLDFIQSNSAIHCCVISGNEKVKLIAKKLQESGYAVKAILSPTVPVGQERLRFCLHAYNSAEEIKDVVRLLRIFVR